MFRFLFFFLLFFPALDALGDSASDSNDLMIATWNVRHLGAGTAKNFEAVAYVASRYDLLALQEVMSLEGLERLVTALEKASGESWSSIHSHLIGRSSYREKYAFIMRDSRVRYRDGAVVYLDPLNRFIREPFSARFEATDGSAQWVMANVHILYGQNRAQRIPEIQALVEFWAWLQEVFPDDDSFLLAGDFNIQPTDPAFAAFREHAHPAISRGATTLSSIDHRYANLYDNIYLGAGHRLIIQSVGIDQYPPGLGLTHKQARNWVSDHAPVFIQVAARGPFTPRGSVPPPQIKGAARPATCEGVACAAERWIRALRGEPTHSDR